MVPAATSAASTCMSASCNSGLNAPVAATSVTPRSVSALLKFFEINEKPSIAASNEKSVVDSFAGSVLSARSTSSNNGMIFLSRVTRVMFIHSTRSRSVRFLKLSKSAVALMSCSLSEIDWSTCCSCVSVTGMSVSWCIIMVQILYVLFG